MADALLQTKLFLPPGRPNLVPRPRLLNCLDQGLNSGQGLTLISAPAGFGKTTLAAEWLHLVQRPVAWLSLDERENDPARFLAYLVAAVQQIDPDLGQTVEALARSPQLPGPESLLTILINELAALPDPFLLAFDDYHLIQNPAVHAQTTFLLENRPPQLHQIILTREDPPLPVARWRARGQVNDIRQADLRFSADETAHFLKDIMGLNLAPADITALERRTEGWIAGLQLAALSMRDQADVEGFVQSVTGSSRYILDYLIEEVFDRQPADVQTFLLQTSILDRISAPLCDAVTKRADSQAMLQDLERANLFLLPADQSRTWYRYHRLFAEFLRHRLRSAGASAEVLLHRRAAGWLEDSGLVEEALSHMLAAGDWIEAERLTNLAAVIVTRRGQLLTVQSWLDAFPDDVVGGSHQLAALKGFGLLLAGRFEEAGNYVELAGDLLPADASSFNRGFLASLRSNLAMIQGDISSALALAQEALGYLEEDDPYFLRGAVLSSLAQALTQAGDLAGAAEAYRRIVKISYQAGQPLFAVGPLTSLAWILNLQGKRNEALILGQEVMDLCISRAGRPLPVSAAAHTILGLLYLEANELEPARTHLRQALTFSDQMGPASGLQHASRLALARLQLAEGEEEAALVTIDEARQIAAQYRSDHMIFVVAGAEAELRFRLGDFAAVERFVDRFGLSPGDTPTHASESYYLTYARLLLAQKRLDEAEALLANLEQFARAGERWRSLITINILAALANHARGRQEPALARLEQALGLAAPEGYRRAFLEEGQAVLDLLPRVHRVAPDFVGQIGQDKQVEPALSAGIYRRQPLPDPLSDRELQVLQLIAAGYSNREIADRLFVTAGTVKTHAHNIYGKLGVNGRTQAVARARELDLL